jgi:hypothetical protein
MAKGKTEKVRLGQVFIDADSRMNDRELTITEVKKQTKNVGRFKRGHRYATCVTGRGVVVKVDEARLFSSAYRIKFTPCPPAAEANIADACPIPPVSRDVCESVENCGCNNTDKISDDEPVNPA